MILSPLSNRFEILACVFVIEVDEGFGGFLVPPDLGRLEVNITFLIIFSLSRERLSLRSISKLGMGITDSEIGLTWPRNAVSG